MSKLKDSIKRIERIINRKETKRNKISEKIDSEICELKNQISKAEIKLGNLEKARQERCKHDEEIGRRSNARDDASFEYWLFCRKCGLDVGHQHFDGSIRYTVPSVGKINK